MQYRENLIFDIFYPLSLSRSYHINYLMLFFKIVYILERKTTYLLLQKKNLFTIYICNHWIFLQNNVDTKAVLVSTSSNNPTCLDPGITSKLARPSFNASPRMPGIFGSSRPHGSLPSRPLSSNVAGHPMVPDSYASNKSFPPSSYSATPNSVSFNGQPNLYQPPNQYLHPAATPSPASWLQHGVVHNPPFLTYPGLMVAPSPFQYGIPSHTPIRPTGLSTPSTSVEKSSFATEKTILPPSGMGMPCFIYELSFWIVYNILICHYSIDLDKQTDSLKNNEVCIANNVINAWMAHKTEEGVIYYYNSLTRVSTYDKPLCFKLEVMSKF